MTVQMVRHKGLDDGMSLLFTASLFFLPALHISIATALGRRRVVVVVDREPS